MTDDDNAAPQTQARKLNRLLELHHRASEPDNAVVAAGVSAETGVAVTEQELSAAREGRGVSLTDEQCEALARYFAVPERYFTADEAGDDIEDQLDFLILLREAGVENLRVCGGTADGSAADLRQTLRPLLEHVKQTEHGSDAPES